MIHLALALVLYAAILWTGLSALRPAPAPAASPALRRAVLACAGLIALTILAGGFVAGLKAGLTYNTFPLMDGRLIPEGYAGLHPWLRNLTENVAAVQFDHRLLASLTASAVLLTVAWGSRSRQPPARPCWRSAARWRRNMRWALPRCLRWCRSGSPSCISRWPCWC